MYWRDTPAVPSTLPLLPAILAYVRPEDRVLDLGCGAGRILSTLVDQGLARRCCGVDINRPSLLAAREKHIPVVQAHLGQLPLADGCADVCFLHAILTCLVPAALRLAVLREVRRVTRRILAVADFLQNPDIALYRDRYARGLDETGESGSFLVRERGRVLYPAHHFTREELHDLLASAGFRVVTEQEPQVRTRSGNIVRGIILAARAV